MELNVISRSNKDNGGVVWTQYRRRVSLLEHGRSVRALAELDARGCQQRPQLRGDGELSQPGRASCRRLTAGAQQLDGIDRRGQHARLK